MMLSFHFIKVYKGEVDKTASPQLIFIQEGVFIMKGIINYKLNERFKGFLLVENVYKGTTRNGDRKSTRLNSSHVAISYAVFCLKKKTMKNKNKQRCRLD